MYDAIIVGAGASGLAAAQRLSEAGLQVLVLEARSRIGGRAHTDYHSAPFPIELGAEFIHGQHTSIYHWAHKQGFGLLPVSRLPRLRWGEKNSPARPLAALSPRESAMLRRVLSDYEALNDERFAHALAKRGQPPQGDVSLGDYLRVYGHDGESLAIAEVLLAQTCCAPLDSLSCRDLLAEKKRDEAGEREFRLREGYSALLTSLTGGVRVRLNSPVIQVNWGGVSVQVHTREASYQAKACLITLPVSLLHQDAIHFDPPLPPAKSRAIAAFRTEAATKLIYTFKETLWDASLTYMAHTGAASRWWTPSYGRTGAAVICAFLTADRAKASDALSADEALAQGLAELASLLGLPLPQLEASLRGQRRVAWAFDPYARGGYAYIPKGAAWAREVLAAPLEGKLFFAGEASAYNSNPQTVHGALDSGRRAAREILNT